MIGKPLALIIVLAQPAARRAHSSNGYFASFPIYFFIRKNLVSISLQKPV
jgi:hypothetical protein